MALTTLALILASIIGTFFIRFDGKLEVMLPPDSDARRTVQFFQDAEFADQVLVELALSETGPASPSLTAAMDNLARDLEQSPLITGVMSFPSSRQLMEDMFFFLERGGEILGAEDASAIEEKLAPENMEAQIRRRYMQMVRPEGSFLREIIRRDPLNIYSSILDRMRGLGQSFAHQAKIDNGHLVHQQEQHGLLILQTTVPVTDTVGSAELINFIQEKLERTPRHISGEIISGHRHGVSNENLLKRDIRLTVTIAAIGFIILFLGVFRDPRAVIIFLIPGAAVLVSVNITGFILGGLSYLVIGFCAVMAGIAVDYGIHVYVSNRHCSAPDQAVRRILAPVIIGGMTTLSVFVAFFFSSIPGYRQLALFSIIAITLAILAAIFILPALLKTGAAPLSSTNVQAPRTNRIHIGGAIFFLLSIPAAVYFARGLQIDTDINQLDGTHPDILAAQESFQERWSDAQSSQAVAVVKADTQEEAAYLNDLFYQQVRKQTSELPFSSLAEFWPSSRTRNQNLAQWRSFWSQEKIEETRKNIRQSAAEYGFSEDAFEPFFESLQQEEISQRPEDNVIISRISERFYQRHNNEHWYMSFFPDTPENVELLEELLQRTGDGFIASQHVFGQALSDTVTEEVTKISTAALIMMLGVSLVLMGDFRKMLTAWFPALCGVSWLFAFMGGFGHTLNLANMIAGIVVIGLCIDYGVFMTHGRSRGDSVMISTRNAVILSAVSTLIGAGVLIFASHPALFSVGVTLVVGISAGAVSALIGVPGMTRLLKIS